MSGWAAVGQIAGDVLPSIINYASTKGLQRDEWDRTKEMWQMTNDYNAPKNVVARLKDAGLNPNLAVGGISGGLATMGSAPSSSHNVYAPQGGGVLAALLQKKELKLKDSEKDMIDTQRAKASSDININEAAERKMEAEKEAQEIHNRVLRHDADIITGSNVTSDADPETRNFADNFPTFFKYMPALKAGAYIIGEVLKGAGLFSVARRAFGSSSTPNQGNYIVPMNEQWHNYTR